MDYRELLINEEESMLCAMKRLSETATKVLFVVEEDEKLIAALTDGDIRRWILKNGNLDAKVKDIANYNPLYLMHQDIENAQKFMRERSIQAVPVVNCDHHIINVFLWDSIELSKRKRKLGVPVVIMAGGKGTRLAPYTNILPKPLIPIGDKTITEHIMDQFIEFGCTHFDMIVNYKKNFIKSYFQDNKLKRDIDFIEEKDFLGTGGGLKLIKGKYKESFFMSNCDILIEEDYASIMDYHIKNSNIITMVCAMKNIVIPYGTVELSDQGRVLGLHEKPDFSFITNTGFYVINPDFLKYIPDHTFIHITDLIQKCIDSKEKVGVYPISENAWMDMGQLEELEKMKMRLER